MACRGAGVGSRLAAEVTTAPSVGVGRPLFASLHEVTASHVGWSGRYLSTVRATATTSQQQA